MSFKFPNGIQGYVEVQAVWRTVPYLLSSPLWHHVCVNYWHDINIPRSLWLVFLLSKKRWKTWSYSTISPNVCFFLSQGAFTAFTLAQVIKIQWPHRQEVNFNIRGSVRVFLRWCEQSHGASFLFIANHLYFIWTHAGSFCDAFTSPASCSHLVFLKPNFCVCSVETPMNLNIHRFHQDIFNILSLCCFYVLHFKKVSTFSVFKAQWHGKRFFCCCRNDCPRMILGFYGQTLWFPNCVWSNMGFLWWCKCPDQEWFRIKQHKLFW